MKKRVAGNILLLLISLLLSLLVHLAVQPPVGAGDSPVPRPTATNVPLEPPSREIGDTWRLYIPLLLKQYP